MLLASPLWLFLLLPWSGVVLWFMLGRRDRVGVPFLDLWRGEMLQPRVRRSFLPPPISVLLILLSCLLAILAATGPSVRMPWLRSNARIVVVVDRGITMSATVGRSTRFANLAGSSWREIARELGHAPVSLRTVPPLSPIATDTYDWFGHTTTMPPTAVDTRRELASTIRRLLNDRGNELVIVLSDQNFEIESERVIQIAPETPLENVGIVHVAAHVLPKPQVMVRVRNDSTAALTTLEVSSDAQRASQQIELPPRGQSRDYFADIPALSQSIEVSIRDDTGMIVADDRAWLARKRVWPRVEARGALPPEVTRVIRAYQRSRPSSEGSPVIAVVSDAGSPPEAASAIVIASGGRIIGADDVNATAADHPITRHVNWDRAVRGARLTEAPAGWNPVISVEGRPVVAIQEGSLRRVWMGIDSSELARSAQFVLIWTNALDWLGDVNSQDEMEFEYETVSHAIKGEWQPRTGMPTPRPRYGEWPGLYERAGDGMLRALNAPTVEFPATRASDDAGNWREVFQQWSDETRRTRSTSLAPMLIVVAITMLAVSAMRWGQRGRPLRANPTFAPQEVQKNREKSPV